MKRSLLMCSLFLGLLASNAFAGLDLSWNACNTDDGAVATNFDCAGGTPSTLYGSWQVPVDQANVVALDGSLNMLTHASPLPSFWHFEGCNQGWDFSRIRPSSGCAGSAAMWIENGDQGAAFLAVGQPTAPPGSEITRWVFTLFNPSGSPVDVPAWRNNFGFALRFLMNNAEEGGGTCQGCSISGTFVWNSAQVGKIDSAESEFAVTGPGMTTNCVTVNGLSFDCSVVPTRNATWGKIKSLYR